MMNVYVVFGSKSLFSDECLVKIFLSREAAENFIAQNEYWVFPRIEEWEAE